MMLEWQCICGATIDARDTVQHSMCEWHAEQQEIAKTSVDLLRTDLTAAREEIAGLKRQIDKNNGYYHELYNKYKGAMNLLHKFSEPCDEMDYKELNLFLEKNDHAGSYKNKKDTK